MTDFVTYVEIPIKIFFSMQKFIPRSFHEEGQAGGPVLEDIQFDGTKAGFGKCDLPDEIKKYIFARYTQDLSEQCWENIE